MAVLRIKLNLLALKTSAQFHVDDLFLGDLNCGGDLAKLHVKPRFNHISRSQNLLNLAKPQGFAKIVFFM